MFQIFFSFDKDRKLKWRWESDFFFFFFFFFETVRQQRLILALICVLCVSSDLVALRAVTRASVPAGIRSHVFFFFHVGCFSSGTIFRVTPQVHFLFLFFADSQ